VYQSSVYALRACLPTSRTHAPQRPTGPNGFGRIILAVPDAKGLAEWLKTQGVENREVIANVAYVIRDPEGNAIELYTAPKP